MNRLRLSGLLLCFGFFVSVCEAVDVTVYNQNLGLVKEKRVFPLKKGENEFRVTDVPSQIDATSVHFKSLTDPDGVSVVEQNFQFDLINQEKLLDRYIGKEIEIERLPTAAGDKKEVLRGTLLSSGNGRILQVGKKIYVNPPGSPVLPELPEGLLMQPTLLWKVSSAKEAKNECEISYLTAGMSWNADYVLVTNAKDDRMDLNTWVTITNTSGGTYNDAKLKLVAGDVNRVETPERRRFAKAAIMEMDAVGGQAQFTEKSFFEYHLYTLQRPTSLKDNETKQIELVSASNVPLKKRFIYDGAQNITIQDMSEYTRTDPNYGTQGQPKVWVMLEFKNSKDQNLGIPLPAGRIRVYKKDTDDSLEFVGEDRVDHTPKDETIRVKMGNAFDVVGERKRVNFTGDSKGRWFEEQFEIKIRNHKSEPVTVTVVEHLYRWNNWKITASSQKWQKKDAQTIEFETPVAKDQEAVVTYTVKYSW